MSSAGYLIHSEASLLGARRAFRAGDFDLVVICHTVPEDEAWRLISDFRLIRPSVPVVVLSAQPAPRPDGEIVASLDGPQVLLDRVASLLSQGAIVSPAISKTVPAAMPDKAV